MSVGVYLDGQNVTPYVLEGSVTHQLNRPSFASLNMVGRYAPGDPQRCKIVIPSGLDFHGLIVTAEDEGDENEVMTKFVFADPTVLFEFRPCRDPDGDFSKPSFIEDNITGPQMVQAVLQQSIRGGDPKTSEGPMGIELGTFKTGGVSLKGAPKDWPMKISDLVAMLVETGEVDVWCEPIDSGGNMGRIHAFNGNFGRDLSGSVSFDYGTGSFNCRQAKRVKDYKDLMNKLWVYLGPRRKPSSDPKGDQHWAANITLTQGMVDPAKSLGPDQGTVRAKAYASREKFYTRMLIRIFDGEGDDAPIHGYELYKRWFLMESWARAAPATHVHMTPNKGIAPAFRVGDLITVRAGSQMRGGFSSVQRVMEYTYKWDISGDIELGAPVGQATVPAVVTSADNEGMRPRDPEAV